MERNKRHENYKAFQLPRPSFSDLRGRQSVRATFRLSARAIHALSAVATHLGIKQKSLFDHLAEDIHSLNLIAQKMQSEDFDKEKRIQKTYVLSRKSLSCFERASKEFDAPRDALVEYSIQRLLPLIEEEKEKHRNRKTILEEICTFLEQGERILQSSEALLGEDDPIHNKLKLIFGSFRSAYQGMESFVEKCEIIEAF